MQTPWKPKTLYRVNSESDKIDPITLRQVAELVQAISPDARALVENMSPKWLTVDDVARQAGAPPIHTSGTYPRRVGQVLFKCAGKDYPDNPCWHKILDIVANAKPIMVQCLLGFTQEFNWRAGHFGDSGSCFWSYSSHDRDMLAYANAWAVRVFHEDASGPKRRFREDLYRGCARAWVVPYPWRMYKETSECDAFILFNGYSMAALKSSNPTYTIASIVASRFGLTSTRIDVHGGVYINGSGYALEEVPRIQRDTEIVLDIPYRADDMVERYG